MLHPLGGEEVIVGMATGLSPQPLWETPSLFATSRKVIIVHLSNILDAHPLLIPLLLRT